MNGKAVSTYGRRVNRNGSTILCSLCQRATIHTPNMALDLQLDFKIMPSPFFQSYTLVHHRVCDTHTTYYCYKNCRKVIPYIGVDSGGGSPGTRPPIIKMGAKPIFCRPNNRTRIFYLKK